MEVANSLQLDVATPERVEVSLPVAGVGYRSLAYLIDVGLIFAFWIVAYFLYVVVGPPPLMLWLSLSGVVKVLLVLAVFFFQWLYWTVFEVLWRGQTPGKRLMHIRIVRADGAPVGVFESAVRNLLRYVDFLPAVYGVGICVMLVDAKHRRLGDLAAGTLALREEQFDLGRYQAPASAAAAAVGRPLTPQEHELLKSYSERFDALEPEARLRIGRQLAQRIGDDVSALGDDAALKAWLVSRGS
jgi:uncharacterized RDD family membrane protein YckC